MGVFYWFIIIFITQKKKRIFLTTNGTLKKKFLNILKTMFMENNKNIIRQEEPKQGTMSEAIKQVVNNQLKKKINYE